MRLELTRSLHFRCLFRNSVSIYYRSEPGQVFISTTFQLKNIENCFFFTPLIFRVILNKKMESKKGQIVFKRLHFHVKINNCVFGKKSHIPSLTHFQTATDLRGHFPTSYGLIGVSILIQKPLQKDSLIDYSLLARRLFRIKSLLSGRRPPRSRSKAGNLPRKRKINVFH